MGSVCVFGIINITSNALSSNFVSMSVCVGVCSALEAPVAPLTRVRLSVFLSLPV